jgi:hypothetical protein
MDYLKAIVLAGVALEVAEYYPDDEKTQADMPRAEWRWNAIEKAMKIVRDLDITIDTEDIDEVVRSYLSREEALS